MQFGSIFVYCTVYDMCVWGGAHINIFSGGPQSTSYGPGWDGHGPSCPGGDDGSMNMDAC